MNVGARAKLIAIGALTAAAFIPASAAAASVKSDFGPAADVTVHPETGKATFVATEAGRALPAPTKGSPEAAAIAFLNDHAGAFGLAGDDRSLSVSAVTPFEGGNSVRVQQEVDGAPVIAGELIVNLNSADEVISVSGETSPSPGVAAAPEISAGEAAEAAIAATAKHSDVDAADLEATNPELSILDSRLLGGPDLGPESLVYRTEVTSQVYADINDFVLVDAESGGIALKFSQIADALVRHHCDANNTASDVPCTAPFERDEGGPPSAISDVNDAYEFTGDTYDFFQTRFGRDSLDDNGLELFSTTRYCESDPGFPCPYNNAFWNGEQMVYGQGLESDDVVGHELGHGLDQYTSGLLYYYQSGAMDESLADVWGELIDQTNGAGSDTASDKWKLGEDISEDHFVGTCSAGPELRNMQDPTLCSLPDKMSSTFYHADTSDNGGVHTNSGVNNKAVYLMVDGGSFNGQAVSGIGIDKTASLYYEVQSTMLTSGSDYKNLAEGLRQACANQTGGALGITAADCAEVNKALLAVEMDGTPADAPNPEAPVCNGTDSPTNFFADDMESGTGWALTGWVYDSGYATSGEKMLYTDDPDGPSDRSATSPAIPVPAPVPAGGTFLRFNHAWGFEHDFLSNYDGGVLEYSTAGAGGPWTDAESLITDVGYNGTLEAAGPLASRDAFVGVSNGYRATRVNLASFAGGTVHFRFRFGSDESIGYFPGWAVDDVTAYTCGAGAPPNNAPVLGAIGNKDATVGNQLSFQVSATDADGDALTYSASNLPAGANFDPASRTFTWTPAAAGTFNNVHFEVSDGTDTDSEDISITVTGGGGGNQPPVLAAIGNKDATVGNQLSFQVSATDPDGDALNYSASNLPAGANFDQGTRTFSWTPTAVGTFNNVHFEVTDGTDTDSEDISITVTGGGANQPPVLAAIGNKNATVGNQLSFQVSATDADADALTYSASNLPAGANFDPASRTFTWTPAAAGTFNNVHFEVSDGTDTDSEDITITVTGGGDTTPPETTIESAPKDVIKVKKGKKATARYVVTANEPGATIEGRINGGVWQGPLAQGGIKIPDLGKGNYTIEFRATDAAGNVDQSPASDSFKVKRKKKRRN